MNKKIIFFCFSLALMITGCDKVLPPGTGPNPTANLKRPEIYPLPFKTSGDYLAVYNGKDYRPLFLKGINLSVALPGTQPGELEISRQQYLDWFKKMGE